MYKYVNKAWKEQVGLEEAQVKAWNVGLKCKLQWQAMLLISENQSHQQHKLWVHRPQARLFLFSAYSATVSQELHWSGLVSCLSGQERIWVGLGFGTWPTWQVRSSWSCTLWPWPHSEQVSMGPTNSSPSPLQTVTFSVLGPESIICSLQKKINTQEKKKKKLERERIPGITLHRDNGPENIRAPFFAFGSQSFLLHKCQLRACCLFWGRHWLDAHLLGENFPSRSESLKLRDCFGPQEMVDCPPLWPWPARGHPFSGCSIKVGLGGEWEGKNK